MIEAMEEAVLERGVPFLGICVGMQLLAERGEEYGSHEGLGWIPGAVRLIERDDPAIKVPHMGWNDVRLARPHPLVVRSEEHTSELQSLMRISYAVFCLQKKKRDRINT